MVWCLHILWIVFMKLKADCIRWKKSSTTTYVEMLAKELKNRGLYKDELTEDYIKKYHHGSTNIYLSLTCMYKVIYYKQVYSKLIHSIGDFICQVVQK